MAPPRHPRRTPRLDPADAGRTRPALRDRAPGRASAILSSPSPSGWRREPAADSNRSIAISRAPLAESLNNPATRPPHAPAPEFRSCPSPANSRSLEHRPDRIRRAPLLSTRDFCVQRCLPPYGGAPRGLGHAPDRGVQRVPADRAVDGEPGRAAVSAVGAGAADQRARQLRHRGGFVVVGLGEPRLREAAGGGRGRGAAGRSGRITVSRVLRGAGGPLGLRRPPVCRGDAGFRGDGGAACRRLHRRAGQ